MRLRSDVRSLFLCDVSKSEVSLFSFFYNSYRDSIILCIVNPMTSILAGVVIFSVLGYMAKIQDIMVAEVVKSGESHFLPYSIL